jgi:L,D-transpeptidase catalytic domain
MTRLVRICGRQCLGYFTFALVAPPLLAFVVVCGCRRYRSPPSVDASPPVPAEPEPARPEMTMAPVADGGPYPDAWVEALSVQVQVLSDTEFLLDKKRDHERNPKVQRLGYLRYGEKVPALGGDPQKKPNCPEGWYSLLAGGFVCGKFVTSDLQHPKLKTVHGPDLDGPLPYTYGVNLFNGTPLYRQIPSHAQRRRLEPWLFRPRKPRNLDNASASSDTNPFATASAAEPVDAGASNADTDETPWWEKQALDGGPVQITLEELQESEGPIARRMVKGFYLSLDHDLEAAGWKWWKTVSGLSAPAERILIQKPLTDYHGVWLGRDDATFETKNHPCRRIDKLPIAFVMAYHARRWTLDESRKHASAMEGELDHFDAIALTGQTAHVGDVEYWETDEGYWLRQYDFTLTDPGPPTESLREQEKWIDVNLKRQTLVAFEGNNPVFATVFSSGRNEHETVPGVFRIREKHISATMDADAELATDGPYSIEDVPYIEYFNGSYALHGAFWHAEFGHVKSHGCVNLSPLDAKALFAWTDPQLPEGWHAVLATKDKPGTRVIVHDRAPTTCEGPNVQPAQCPPLDGRGRPIAP